MRNIGKPPVPAGLTVGLALLLLLVSPSAHAGPVRVDATMLLGSIFLLLVGADSWSLDARLAARVGNGDA